MAKTARVKSDQNLAENDDATTSQLRPTEEEIAVRAYHIYLERCGAEGDPYDDWLQAERELCGVFDHTE